MFYHSLTSNSFPMNFFGQINAKNHRYTWPFVSSIKTIRMLRPMTVNRCFYLFKTTYAPKNIFVHTFSKKHKDVIEKTNIRHLRLTLVSRKCRPYIIARTNVSFYSSICILPLLVTKTTTLPHVSSNPIPNNMFHFWNVHTPLTQ